eukprot:scaffold290629_cov47-Prasinocladus_malaysianus.AAC.1
MHGAVIFLLNDVSPVAMILAFGSAVPLEGSSACDANIMSSRRGDYPAKDGLALIPSHIETAGPNENNVEGIE